MRVHMTSRGLDPARLTPGHDLVLAIAPAHGLALADGVVAEDLLDSAAHHEIHASGLPAIARCRETLDRALTVDGLCLTWLWELPLERALVALVCHAETLRRAVERFDVSELVLVGPDDRTRNAAAAVATAAGIRLREEPAGAGEAAGGAGAGGADVAGASGASAAGVAGAGGAGGAAASARAAAAGKAAAGTAAALGAARRRAVTSARELGIPTRLRRGSVVFVSYWPLMALLDRMLDDPARRPAVLTQRLPADPKRSLKAAARGGWIGSAGPSGRRAARRAAAHVIAAAERGPAPRVEAFGLDLGSAARDEVVAIARDRAEGDLAMAGTLERAFRGARPAAIVSAWDVEPLARLTTRAAQAAGIRTIALAHGAFLLPQTLVDLDLCDEVLLWSHAVAPPITNLDRPIHVVGYPEPRPAAPPTRPAPRGERPRVLVLAQPTLPGMGLTNPRIAMRQYTTAVDALLDRRPGAQIVLRPHPSAGLEAEHALEQRHPGTTFEIDRASTILDALAGCDLCIGTITTATLQAALVGTPVVALNLMGFEWSWPLGGDTTVPIARDGHELGACLDVWLQGSPLPGRDELLAALGARPEGDDPTDRMLAILDRAGAASS
jgi:hypothetical protein